MAVAVILLYKPRIAVTRIIYTADFACDENFSARFGDFEVKIIVLVQYKPLIEQTDPFGGRFFERAERNRVAVSLKIGDMLLAAAQRKRRIISRRHRAPYGIFAANTRRTADIVSARFKVIFNTL